MPSESVSPEELADAYWGNYERRRILDKARAPRSGGQEAGEQVLVDGRGWRVGTRKGSGDDPETGLEWASAMVECIVVGETWDDVYDAGEEGRAVRLAPTIDRLDLVELLAERAPDDDAAAYLGADALEHYLGSNPDVARVEQAAARSDRFRLALAGAWFERR